MPEQKKKYDKKLYKDIERKMAGMTEEEKAAFMLELGTLREMVTEEECQKAIDNAIDAYMVPLNDDGELDKALFEQRAGIFEKVRMEKLCVPAGKIVLKNKQEHSDLWIYDYINSCTELGVYQVNKNVNVLFGSVGRQDMEKFIEAAYPDKFESGYRIYLGVVEEKRKEILKNWPEETKKEVLEGIDFLGDSDAKLRRIQAEERQKYEEAKKEKKEHLIKNPFEQSEKYKKEQKVKEKNDLFMDQTEKGLEFTKVTYAVVRDMDLSYISSNKTYEKVQEQIRVRSSEQRKTEDWVPERSVDQNMDNLAANLKSIKIALKEVSGYRWRDSKEFNQIKDDLKELQGMLKKGSSRENREQIMESLAKFSKDCKTYQDKNPGVRKTSRGNQRKQLVAGIQGILEDQLQKIMAPEMEAEMKEAEARQRAKAAEELAKDSSKREKVDAKAFLNEGRKSVPVKAKSDEKKEKEPELSRKSLEPGALKK